MIPHESNLELLQRIADVRPDDIVDRPDMFKQFGRQRFVADGTGTQLVWIDRFCIECLHESIVSSNKATDAVGLRLRLVF